MDAILAASAPLPVERADKLQHRIDGVRAALAGGNGSRELSERIIARVETWLLDDEQKAVVARTPLYLFYLEAAAYLKPAGSSIGYGPDSGIDDPIEAKAISDIIAACEGFAQDGRLDPSADGDFRNSGVPILLLAAALALAERLELHHPATLNRIGHCIREQPVLQGNVLARAFEVQSIGPQPERADTVRVRIQCSNASAHSGLKHYETDIGRFLASLNKTVRPRFAFNHVRFEIQACGYEPMDYKFRVDGAAALQLFMGHTLYGDKRVFLRELVQNAVDACHLRSMMEPDYTPAITIQLNREENRITIRDNGIGMDRRWLEKYFLNVGISFYRSGEAGDISLQPALQRSFISNFGIGFLSTFLIADRIVVKTRRKGAGGLLITITDIGDYFDVRPAPDTLPTGTEVLLELKTNRLKGWRGMEYLGYLKSVARFVSIPIQFTDAAGHTTVIGCEPLNRFGDDASAHNFSAPLEIAPSRGWVLIRTRGDDERSIALDTSSGGLSIYQNGIFIDQSDDLLPAKARKFVTGRLDLTGEHVCELSMDRHRIFWPQKQLRYFRQAVLAAIAQAGGRLLNAASPHELLPPSRQRLEQTLASFFDITTMDDVLFQALPQGVRDLLRKQLRALLRTSLSKSDSPGRDLLDIAEAQGFQHEWQQTVIKAMAQ